MPFSARSSSGLASLMHVPLSFRCSENNIEEKNVSVYRGMFSAFSEDERSSFIVLYPKVYDHIFLPWQIRIIYLLLLWWDQQQTRQQILSKVILHSLMLNTNVRPHCCSPWWGWYWQTITENNNIFTVISDLNTTQLFKVKKRIY